MVQPAGPPDGPPAAPRPLPGQLRGFLPDGGLSAPHEVAAAACLTEAQAGALQLVVKEARTQSEANRVKLQARLEQWGYPTDAVDQVLAYIKDEAPIIIHIDLAKRLPRLRDDTHYRNQFETGLTCGSSDLTKRKSWESRLFKGIYDNASNAERVKYGVLNAVNDPQGIASVSSQYGKDYLVLKRVRLRTTFSDKDSCNEGLLASCEWYAHVLALYNDLELKAVTEVALGEKLFADSSVLETARGGYKEVQIHGDICFQEHIEAVVLHSDRLGTTVEGQVQEWCQKIGARLEFMPAPASASATPGVVLPESMTADGKKAAPAPKPPVPSWMSCLCPTTPTWSWGPLRLANRRRFDPFNSARLEAASRLEARILDGEAVDLPVLPVGEVWSVNFEGMQLIVTVGKEEAAVALERCSRSPPRPTAAPGRTKARRVVITTGPEEAPAIPSTSAVATWEWCASASGSDAWSAYAAGKSAQLEAAFASGRRETSLTIGSSRYKIDFENKLQINTATQFVRHIRRRASR